MHSHGPNLVPPFQSISLNLTTTAESLLQYQADPIDFEIAELAIFSTKMVKKNWCGLTCTKTWKLEAWNNIN